ncbi:PP2C family protein-serine/threonine phosphatase [Kitasatospora sp. NPDC054939]
MTSTAPAHSSRTPARAVLWSCLGLAAVLAAGTAMFALDQRDTSARAATVLDSQVWPARKDLNELVVAVHLAEAAQRSHQLTGDPVFLAHRAVQTAHARELSGELVRLTAGTAPADRAAALARTLDTWSTDRADAGAQETLRAAQGLSDGIRRESDRAHAAATEGRERMFAHLAVGTAALLVLLALVSGFVWRRMLVPLTDLEHHLRRTAAGRTDHPHAPCPHPHGAGWLAGAWRSAEHARLQVTESRRAARRDREALERDAETSLGVFRILTAHNRPGPGVLAHGHAVPAEGVIAGDFHDTLALPDGRTALLQGDVSGHGTAAGLLAVQIKSAVVAALRLGHGPRAAAEAAWSALAPEDERFATLVIAVLDPVTRRLSWLNAGHEEPFLRRGDGRIERLAPTGPLLSSVVTDPTGAWDVEHTGLHDGDLLVIATDGLTEARAEDGTLLGEEAVVRTLRAAGPAAPADLVAALHGAAERHATHAHRDDITILAARLGEPSGD